MHNFPVRRRTARSRAGEQFGGGKGLLARGQVPSSAVLGPDVIPGVNILTEAPVPGLDSGSETGPFPLLPVDNLWRVAPYGDLLQQSVGLYVRGEGAEAFWVWQGKIRAKGLSSKGPSRPVLS